MSAPTVVAVDLGGTSIKGARVGADGRVLAEQRRSTPYGAAAVEALRALATELVADDTVAIGVVSPGPVDEPAGIVRRAPNLGWRDMPLRALLADALGLPVALGHDLASAGRAEYAAHPRPDLLFVALGTGVACTHLLDGVAQRGATQAAGELGHTVIRPGGEPCSCGNRGCLETVMSGWGIERAAGRSAAEVVAALGRDPVADRVWRAATEGLGDALALVTALLDPGVIVIGGGLAAAGDVLLDPVRTQLATGLPWRAAPPVELGVLGPVAARRGAELLAWSLVPLR